MGKLIGFIKTNLLVVVFTTLTLLMLPGAFVASSAWNNKIRSQAETEYSDSKREIDSASKVTYQLPAVFEGEDPITDSRAPNAAVTAFYQTKREDRTRQVSAVVGSAVGRNRGTHEVLMPDLLPNQPDTRTRERLTEDFAAMLLGRENQASVYKRLLDRINAGEPIEGDELAALVGDFQVQITDDQNTSSNQTPMTSEQKESMTKRLIERRLALVAQRSEDLSVYANVNSITGATGSAEVSQPPREGQSDAKPEDLFRWQWDYWVIEDILGAVAIANSDETGPTGVPDSVVKRIDRILVQQPDLSGPDTAVSSSEEEDDYGRPSSSSSSGGGLWGSTHTGRLAEMPEGMDVRMVRLEAVVSTSRLPRLFQALGEQNFMTVTSVKLQDIEAWEELENGFYFGPEHVAKAVIDIETVWLREWTQDSMPDDLRETLGIPREIETDGGDEG